MKKKMELISQTDLTKKLPITLRTAQYYGDVKLFVKYNQKGELYERYKDRGKSEVYYSLNEITEKLNINNLDEMLIDLKECTKLMKLTRSKVLYLCRKGKIQFYKFKFGEKDIKNKTQYYFKKSEIENYKIK